MEKEMKITNWLPSKLVRVAEKKTHILKNLSEISYSEQVTLLLDLLANFLELFRIFV